MTTKTKSMAAITSLDDIEIEISTRPAYRLWTGREKTERKHGILGIPGFCSIMKKIEGAIRSDDPYADYFYHKIELAIVELADDLEGELKDMETFISENIPSSMRLPEAGSKRPEVVKVRIASSIGFQLIYQMLKVDKIVVKVLLANHIGILPNKQKFQTIARLEQRVRGVMQQVYAYKFTGVTRDDMVAKNPVSIKAKEAMGDLAQGYLEGSLRGDNAPSLPKKREQTLEKKKSNQDGNLEGALDKIMAAADRDSGEVKNQVA